MSPEYEISSEGHDNECKQYASHQNLHQVFPKLELWSSGEMMLLT